VKPAAPLLPAEINECNSELESARESLLQAIERERVALVKLHFEEGKLQEVLLSVFPDAAEVAEKMERVKLEINESGSVSTPSFNALRDVLIEAKTRAEELKDNRLRLKKLQMKNLHLHKQYDGIFSSHDVNLRFCTAVELEAVEFSSVKLKECGYTARTLKVAGYTAKELMDAGYTGRELKECRYTKEMKGVGYTAIELRDAGYTARALNDVGYTTKEMKNVGYSVKEMKDAGFSLYDFKEADYSAYQFRGLGVYLPFADCCRLNRRDA
jgi:hypothetical protein